MWKILWRILAGVVIFLLAALAWLGYEAHAVYNDVAATYRVEPRISPEPAATPVTNFFGDHRINFLLLGSDNDNKPEEKRPLTQSMIVVSIDPVHDQVNMLSIPRDFWVHIPGHGMGKIDLAAKYGGLALARATVERLFHLNIDYYAWVGLNGFSSVVDDFGGITINVTHPILDDFYPNDQVHGNPYAYTRLFLPAGWRHLSGRQALEYVRSRHGDLTGDFGRSARQQQILIQLQKKANGWNLLFKIPQLAHDLRGLVQTDLNPTKLFDVARLARHISVADIHQVILSAPTYCHYAETTDGQSILVPNWTAIRPVVSQLFAPLQAPAPVAPSRHLQAAPPAATPTPKPAPAAPPAAPTPAPAASTPQRLPGTLVYAAGGTVYQMDPQRRVTDLMPSWMTAADMPAVSPDGSTLVFMRWSTYASDLYAYHLRTRQVPTQITDDASPNPRVTGNYLWAAWPSWSADGKTIVFSSDRYKLQWAPSETRQLDLAIYAMNPDGSSLRQVTLPAAGAGGDTDPQFRGHTSQILYDHWAYRTQNGLAVGDAYSQLMIRDLNDPNAAWALTPAWGQIVQPALDRSGDRVAFVRTAGPASQLVVADITNTKNGPQLRGEHVIASGEVAQPAFTPDGRWVSYLRADGDGFDIELEPVDGGVSLRLSQAGNGVDALSRPIWVS